MGTNYLYSFMITLKPRIIHLDARLEFKCNPSVQYDDHVIL